ncbi:MAG: hypothetical protein HOP19_24565, partial [Acidobacteria bacterium]|nr:hypothetical protein [Acidobacteriota bacterium]
MIRSRYSSAFAVFICVFFLGIVGWQLRSSTSVAAQGVPAPVTVWSPTGGPQDAQTTALFFNQGQLFAAASESVWASSDSGRTWQKRGTGLPELALPASFAALENTLFVGTRLGVYRSTDGGQRWQAANVGFPSNPLSCFLTTEADRLYALTFNNGLFVSTDKGDSWTPLNQGLPGYAYAYSVRNGVSWVSTARGVYRSTDGGQSWARVHQGIPNAAVVTTMAIVGERVFASAIEPGATGSAQLRGVFVWDEPMSRWLAFNDGLNSLNINQLFAHGTDLYAATDRGVSRTEAARAMWVSVSNGLRGNATVMAANGTTLIAGSGGDLFTSTNRGDSWTSLNARFGTAAFFTAFAYNNAGAYVATPSGVFLRPNQVPAVWRRVSEGLTDAFVIDLATQGQTLWAASRSGVVHFSGNNGDSWTNLSTGLTNQSLTTIAANDRMVFVGTQASGVFSLIRRDGRDQWQAANEGLGASRRIHDLLATNTAIYVATDKGIYRSTNDGALWTSLNVALPTDGSTGKMLEPKSLALDGTTLYAILGVPTDPTFIGFGLTTPNVALRYDLNTAQWAQVQISPNVPADFAQILVTQQGMLALGPGNNGFGVVSGVGFPVQLPQAPVWVSTDKGATWNPADAGLRRGGFFGFIFQPTTFYSQAILLGATPTQGLVATLNDQGIYARDLVSLACRFEVNTRTNTLPPATATIAVTVTASANTCSWRAESQSDWITVVGGSGATGSGEVQLNLAANPTTASRNGSVL